MKTLEIRQRFTDYFNKTTHQTVPSSSLIPQDDPTLLFANAGMNQFKDYFTGKAIPKNKRAVSIQKCVRAGGKHNDLENVGHTARHHTFFEMLGNFSFGDYFKKDAILFAWEFLTETLKIPKEKLYITIHYTDDEASQIWQNEIGLRPDRIFKKDQDNFWEMGEFGPCGPCSEIFYDHGSDHTDPDFQPSEANDILDDTLRYVEIWNLVFMQFEKRPEGTFPLPCPSIDTGAGLERLAAVMQGVYWNYDADGFRPIISHLEKLSGKKYGDPKYTASMRVVADHIRSSTMLITDGVIPSNEGRGYVLRRIIRRAIRHLKELEIKDIAFYKLVPAVFESLGETYPTNASHAALAQKFLEAEERKFLETLDQGLKFLNDVLSNQPKLAIFPGDFAFKLYDTYGFPLDLTETILQEKKIALDHQGFEKAMKVQKETSKKSWKGADFQQLDKKFFYQLKEKFGNTEFLGYSQLSAQAQLKAIYPLSEKEEEGENEEKGSLLFFDKTPFYGESGGQVGDQGEIFFQGHPLVEIHDTKIPIEGLVAHYTPNAEKLEVGKLYTLQVSGKRRELTARNHSATHLLQAGLIKILGGHVKQSGSLVNHEKLRFDFTHIGAVTKEELSQVEKLINEQIENALPVTVRVVSKDEAMKKGAMALFNEKYGDEVRTIEMGGFSLELCGGTHVDNTSEIQYFSILSESALSSGVRRIEAVTSDVALKRLKDRSQILENLERTLKVGSEKILSQIESMRRQGEESNKEIEALKKKLQSFEGEKLFTNPEYLHQKYPLKITQCDFGSDLKKLSDVYANKYPDGILLLYTLNGEKVSALLRASKNITHLDCSKILGEALPILEGRGGGRKEMAQGQGSKSEKILEFNQKVKELLTENLK